MTPIECPCGTLKLQVSGAPLAQFYCHCDDCQAVHGAAYIPVSVFPAEAVKITAGSALVWSRRATPRTACAHCGTRVFAEVSQIGVRCVNALLLPSFTPQFHMHCRFALRPVKDELPHFASLPPAFGGTDAVVEW